MHIADRDVYATYGSINSGRQRAPIDKLTGVGLAAKKILELPRYFPLTMSDINFTGFVVTIHDTSIGMKDIDLKQIEVGGWGNLKGTKEYPIILARRLSDVYMKMLIPYQLPVTAFGGGFFGIPNRNNSKGERRLLGYEIAAVWEGVSGEDQKFITEVVRLVNGALVR